MLGVELKDLGGQEHDVADVAFSPDGTAMVTIEAEPGRAAQPRLRDAVSTRERAWLSGHTGHVLGAVFSPDSGLVATFSEERVQVWDVRTGERREVLDAKSTRHVAFSGDGRRFVTAPVDGIAAVWDIAVGERIDSLPALRGIAAVAFDRHDEHVAIGLSDGSLRIWRLLPSGSRMIELARRRLGRK